MKQLEKSKQAKGLDYNHAELYPNQKMLSSSQVLTYLEDPEKFYTEYVMEIRRPTSNAMHIGKIFSAMYADRKFKWKEALQEFDNGKGIRPYRIYEALDEAIKLFPVIPKRECEYPLKCKYRNWIFRATLDGFANKKVDIENKTGGATREWRDGWVQQRVDQSLQITFQYWVKWKRDGVVFDACILNWVDLRANTNQLVKTFETVRFIDELLEFEEKVDKVINGIENKFWG